MDTLGTYDTREEAQQEYERRMSASQLQSQPLRTPEAVNKRRRSAAQINLDALKEHDGMTDSILRDYTS